nr:diguanylate cyclase [uncultured Cellulosilyticum sp.]
MEERDEKKVRGLFLVGLIAVICTGTIFAGEKENSKNKLIAQIINVKKGKGEVEEKLLQTVVNKIEEDEENIVYEEAFILGYHYYILNEFEKAEIYLEHASLAKDETVKLYATIFLTQIWLKQGLNEEVIAITQKTLDEMSPATYNKEHIAITDFMQQIIYLEKGKDTVIESIEKVLQEEQRLNVEVMCDLKNKQAVLYFYKGNYARGIERFLEVMAHTETMTNKYYGAKAQIDLGVIYGALGNYEEAEANFKEALEIEITDLEDMAFIKTYASINLYENMLYKEDYEGVKAINETVLSYAQYLPENLYESIAIMNDIFLCNYYIKIGDLEEAKLLLREIESNLKAPEEYRYLSVHTNYILLKAAKARAEGDVAVAANLYGSLLQQEDKQFKKYILKNLSELLNENGYYKEANEYEQQLRMHYEQEAIAVNMDYSDYALYKYENQKKLMEEANQKIRRYVYITIYGILLLALIVMALLKYIKLIQINKLDGLTKIYNRRYFEEYYRKLQSRERLFTIMIFDIDYFKKINDTYGHLAGDEVIKKVVEIARGCVESKGKIFRYGGEEFVIMLDEVSKQKALQLAEKIRCTIAQHEWQQDMKVTISIGITQATKEERDVLNQADLNLYTAKAQGRNQIIYK